VCPDDCLPLQEESNERLEFLGDSILNFVIAEYLYERYPTMNEGFLTVMRTRLVNGNMLAHLSSTLNLGKLLIVSKQIEASNGRENKNLLEDAFESLLGAIYLDFNEYKMNTNGKIGIIDNTGIGFQVVKTFIINVIETYVDFSDLIRKKNNPKDTLIKQCQHSFQWTPNFYEIDVQEKNQKKIHTVCIKNDSDTIISTANGDSRKKAELAASKKALTYFGWD
jgi:ribonuclease-3